MLNKSKEFFSVNFSKSIYKSRFFGYRTVRSLVQVLDGILSFLLSPFSIDCDIYINWCQNSLKKDMERRRIGMKK